MAATGSYVFRDGKCIKVSDRIPRLRPIATLERDDASVDARIAEGYRHLERNGSLRRTGPGHYSTEQIRSALHI